jgi:hypothetical protein
VVADFAIKVKFVEEIYHKLKMCDFEKKGAPKGAASF